MLFVCVCEFVSKNGLMQMLIARNKLCAMAVKLPRKINLSIFRTFASTVTFNNLSKPFSVIFFLSQSPHKHTHFASGAGKKGNVSNVFPDSFVRDRCK